MPEDSKNFHSGKLFWTGDKRIPEPITYDPNDPMHFKFIVATANLIA